MTGFAIAEFATDFVELLSNDHLTEAPALDSPESSRDSSVIYTRPGSRSAVVSNSPRAHLVASEMPTAEVIDPGFTPNRMLPRKGVIALAFSLTASDPFVGPDDPTHAFRQGEVDLHESSPSSDGDKEAPEDPHWTGQGEDRSIGEVGKDEVAEEEATSDADEGELVKNSKSTGETLVEEDEIAEEEAASLDADAGKLVQNSKLIGETLVEEDEVAEEEATSDADEGELVQNSKSTGDTPALLKSANLFVNALGKPATAADTVPEPAPAVRKEFVEGKINWSSIKRGNIMFTWRDGLAQKKVPYWIVPDSMMNDPLLVEKVVDAMGLMEPHLLLRFSRVRTPMERWNNYWDFDKSGDDEVDEDELPFKLPPGMSRDRRGVAEYLCSIAQDRVRNILSGVCSACNQAGAWIELGCYEEQDTPYGLVDHVGPLLGKASNTNSVIFSTYSLEERRKTSGDESERFVKTLLEFAGEDDATWPRCVHWAAPVPTASSLPGSPTRLALLAKGPARSRRRDAQEGRCRLQRERRRRAGAMASRQHGQKRWREASGAHCCARRAPLLDTGRFGAVLTRRCHCWGILGPKW